MPHNIKENDKGQDVALSGYLHFSHPIQGKLLNPSYSTDDTKIY